MLFPEPESTEGFRPRMVLMLAPAHRSGLWLVLGAFALLGLFAMHGLGGHGAGHGASHGATHVSEGKESHHHEGHAAPAAGSVSHVAHNGQVDVAEACHRDCADGSTLLMVLCLAVLSVVAVAALLLRHLLGPAFQVALRRSAASLNTLLREARGPGPPGRFALSVQRC